MRAIVLLSTGVRFELFGARHFRDLPAALATATGMTEWSFAEVVGEALHEVWATPQCGGVRAVVMVDIQ